jgi:hypothetical protein
MLPRKRWRFSAVVTVGVYVLVAAWVLARAAWNGGDTALNFFGDIETTVPATVAFALSLSLTRYIAAAAAKLSRGALFNSLSFALLLVFHLLLLMYWTWIVLVLELVTLGLFGWLLNFLSSGPSYDIADIWMWLRELPFSGIDWGACIACSFWDTRLNPTPPWRRVGVVSDGAPPG